MIQFVAALALAHPFRNPQAAGQGNGYEDYLKATQLLADAETVYIPWSPTLTAEIEARRAEAKKKPADEEGNPAWSVEQEQSYILAKKLQGLDYLAVERLAAKRYAPALDLVRLGNRKPSKDPAVNPKVDTLHPEWSKFRALAKLLAIDAYVQFADGHSAAGTDDLLEGLTFAHQIAGGSLMAELISISCRTTILDEFAKELPKLSKKDAISVQTYVERALAEPPTLPKAVKGERDMHLASIDLFFEHPQDLASGSGFAVPAFFRNLTPKDLESSKDGLRKAFADFYAKLLPLLAQDESRWKSIDDGDLLPPEPASVHSVPELVATLERTFLPTHNPAILSELRSRTQLRLLGLHARVIQYRWENGHLPGELKECVPADHIHDPFSGSDFKLQTTETGYKLFSPGIASTGPIELHHTRARKTNPIPPS